MKKIQMLALVLLPALLAGCSQIARSAADNREVSALPLAGQDFSGSLAAGASQAVRAQGLTYSTTLNFAGTFDDLDLSSLPGIVGQPSGLDIPVAFASANFTACGTTAPVINVVVKSVSLTVSDAAHPSGATVSQANLNIPLTLTLNGGGYAVSYGGSAAAAFMTLSAPWATFAPIAVKSGANTPNTFAASVGITTDQGAASCKVSFRTPPNLPQHVRFQ